MPLSAEALGQLIDQYWPALVAWVGASEGNSEDIVQSAFIKLATEEPPPHNCAAWLFTVSKRLAINEYKSRFHRKRRESYVSSEKSAFSANYDPSDDFEIRDLISKLDAREREVVVARIWGELSFDQIADSIGESKATVWRVYQAGLVKLRTIYGVNSHE